MIVDLRTRLDAEGIRDKVLENREVTLQARNNSSLDQFANGKIEQVMSDSETMKRYALGMPPAAAIPSSLSAKQASPFALQP